MLKTFDCLEFLPSVICDLIESYLPKCYYSKCDNIPQLTTNKEFVDVSVLMPCKELKLIDEDYVEPYEEYDDYYDVTYCCNECRMSDNSLYFEPCDECNGYMKTTTKIEDFELKWSGDYKESLITKLRYCDPNLCGYACWKCVSSGELYQERNTLIDKYYKECSQCPNKVLVLWQEHTNMTFHRGWSIQYHTFCQDCIGFLEV